MVCSCRDWSGQLQDQACLDVQNSMMLYISLATDVEIFVEIVSTRETIHRSISFQTFVPASSSSRAPTSGSRIPTPHHQRLGDQGSQDLGADLHRALRIYHTDVVRAATVLLWRQRDKPRFADIRKRRRWEVREDVGRMKLGPRGGADVGCVNATSGTYC